MSLAVLFLAACGRGPALELADFVDFQSEHVTTRVISVPERVNLDRLGFGWRMEGAESPDTARLRLHRRLARVTLFAARGEVTGVELEGRVGTGAALKPVRFAARLNDEPVGRVRVHPELDRYRLEFPAGSVRTGLNFLDLTRKGRPQPGTDTRLRIQRLRFLGAETRNRRSRQERIVTVGKDIEMPAPSYLDAVFVATRKARFETRVEATGREDAAPAVVEVELRGRAGMGHGLSRHELASGENARIRVPLSQWAGELVRLRLSVSGPAGAQASWRHPRVRGVEGPGSDPLAAIRIVPEAPPISARLDRSDRKPDVLLILLDAARSDAFSCYGASQPTPAIDALAADGTRFARALAPSSWTGQSVSSVFTGVYPDGLGVKHWLDALPPATPTLAELFADAGYRTVLWSQHPFYRGWSSLVRGFQQVNISRSADPGELPRVEDLIPDDRPTLAVVHLLPPHTPYEPPPPFRGSLTGWYRGDVEPEATFLHEFPHKRDPGVLNGDDRRYIRERYLEHVAFADSLVGRLVDGLREAGRYEDALVGVFSDHGEGFLEHDEFLHTSLLHREFLQIPLVVKWPGSVEGAVAVVDQTVGSIDLVPTLVDGLALETGGRGFQGRSLLPVVFDGAAPERCHYAVTSGVGRRDLTRPRAMIECDGWKLHYDPITEERRLYRIDDDSGEQVDLGAERPDLAHYLRQELLRQGFFNQNLAGPAGSRGAEQALDAETVERLKALGYLGGNR